MASCLQKNPSGNESRVRKEKLMKWVFQTLEKDRELNNIRIRQIQETKIIFNKSNVLCF